MLILRHRSGLLGLAVTVTVTAAFLVPQTGRAANRSTTRHSRPATRHSERPASVVGLETSPPIRLLSRPADPRAGQRIQLVVVGASGPNDVSWDLTGNGAFSLHTGTTSRTTFVLATPGPHRVGVQVRTSSASLRATLLLTIRPAAAKSLVKRQGSAARPVGPNQHRAVAVHGQRHSVVAVPLAHAAGDPGVTIADFHFTPGSTTIHTGDTITWTNNGPSSHTATASNGSFNTGVLHKGQSSSHTFTQVGTYSYFCSIHPFMHGTIVVLAATKAVAPSSTTANQTTPPTSTTAPLATSAGTLPMTGMDVLTAWFVGLTLVGLGLGLRRVLTPRPAAERFPQDGEGTGAPRRQRGQVTTNRKATE